MQTPCSHAHSAHISRPARAQQQIPGGEGGEGCLVVAVPGGLAPQSPSSIFPKGPQFLGREGGVTAFRAIAPQALPTTWLPGLSGWGGGGTVLTEAEEDTCYFSKHLLYVRDLKSSSPNKLPF